MRVPDPHDLQAVDAGVRTVTRRDVLLSAGCASFLGIADTAHALCAGSPELGRWRISVPNTNPELLDLRMSSCGDQVLNGEQTQTRYRLRAWVRQSDGNWYGRPSVNATWRNWNGKRWLVGRVPTGGYVDAIWTRAEHRDGKRMLRVVINHESLDSKPSSTDAYWYQFVKDI
jgi:hypothetical protein